MPEREFDAEFRMSWPEDWEFEAIEDGAFRLRPRPGGGRFLDVWYSTMPGSLGQDEMDEWIHRQEAKSKAELGLSPFMGGLFSDVGPSAVLQGLTHDSSKAEWRVLMLLAMPRALLTGEYHHPVGTPGSAAANIGAIRGEVDRALGIFFSARPSGTVSH